MVPNSKNPKKRTAEDNVSFDAVIVGAGFAGMYMLHCLRGMGLSARVYEAGGGVGGVQRGWRAPVVAALRAGVLGAGVGIPVSSLPPAPARSAAR